MKAERANYGYNAKFGLILRPMGRATDPEDAAVAYYEP